MKGPGIPFPSLQPISVQKLTGPSSKLKIPAVVESKLPEGCNWKVSAEGVGRLLVVSRKVLFYFQSVKNFNFFNRRK